MTGKHGKSIIAIAVVTLVVLNIWRWWPVSTDKSEGVGGLAGVFSVRDFEVKAVSIDSVSPLSRDIFHPQKAELSKPRIASPLAEVPPAPLKTPEEIAMDSAQAEFAQIRCVGISVRNGRIQAYIVNAGDPLLISIGDKVGSRFVVEKILTDGVSLRDFDTGVGGLITMSGETGLAK